uniref:LysM domain-containing protein n=1 Tax=Palpitomonas bilix TaxID=652834 RepID=A0A7S3DBV9_9EUKA|mmetsp:Transcript_30245/g.78197  ORF Transcript_30245/g.78197 Transcript_30245/m.78197 type:complete len:451 (+) Transcript_30245:443-1795(+)|eukprot:CAMPEP_0113879662 /NCGR_PEP_ID=MMETSP0780_2-20120614/7357_1 /TAXON_ID=652834 /ORGANISM="Palpitomonas bilix" /LENGTH=450 /DNA_ID=CAMNT_0000866257 /DNA_START=371 /DNA_END=1723 /DNA_ORIENTATION=+ /assembly_acc=CAM_ASM_000599
MKCVQALFVLLVIAAIATPSFAQFGSDPEWIKEELYDAFVGEMTHFEATFDPHCPLAAPLTSLSLSVLEDPGVPAGMTFSTKSTIYTAADTAVLEWIPDRGQLLSSGPNGLEVADRVNFTVIISADYLCGKVTTGVVETSINIALRRSQLDFVAPANGSRFVARVGCHSSFEVFGDELSDMYGDVKHYGLHLDEDSEWVMPPGASIVVKRDKNIDGVNCGSGVDVGHCPEVVFGIDWTPQRGQEGFNYEFCVILRDEFSLSTSKRCFTIIVLRCEVCVKSGDTFRSLATTYDTEWMQLWGANHWVTKNPNALAVGQSLYLGTIYTVRPNEDIDMLATRFNLPNKFALLAVNPDLNAAYYEDTLMNTTYHSQLFRGQKICVVPPICSTEDGSPSQVAIGQETFGSSLGQKIVGRDWQWVRGQRKHTGEEYVQGSDPNRANNVREDPTDSPL